MKTDCLFCRIIRGNVAATRVYEDDKTLVIQDLHPRASVCWLLLPKACPRAKRRMHVASLLEVEDSEFLSVLLLTGRRLAQERGLTGPKGNCVGPRRFRITGHPTGGCDAAAGCLQLWIWGGQTIYLAPGRVILERPSPRGTDPSVPPWIDLATEGGVRNGRSEAQA